MHTAVEFEYPKDMTAIEFDRFIKLVEASADVCGVKVHVSGKRVEIRPATPSGFVRRRRAARSSL